MSGYSGTPLPKKLGIREGHQVAAVRAPDTLADALVPWPSGARIEHYDAVADLASADGRFDVILFFAALADDPPGGPAAGRAGDRAGGQAEGARGESADEGGGAGEGVESVEALRNRITSASDALEVAGGLWVAWAKMKSPLFSGLKDSHVRDAGLRTGLVDNKVCAIDDDWSGLRFVFRKEDRARIRAERGEG